MTWYHRSTTPRGQPRHQLRGSTLRTNTGATALLIAVITALAACAGIIETTSAEEALGLEGTDLRVNARVVDGRVQFALQERVSGASEYADTFSYNEWRERELPTKNKMPPGNAATGWLYSSPIAVAINSGDRVPHRYDARIAAQRLNDGRIEFGLQVRNVAMRQWSEIALPTARFLPAGFDRRQWLHSSQLNLADIVPPVPSGLPVNAEGVVRRADLDGYSFNGQEATLYYGTRVDPIDSSHDTWVVAVAATDDSLYDTIRLQVSCYDGRFGLWFWEDGLPYAASNTHGNRFVAVDYRFDDGDAVRSARWWMDSGSDDSVHPLDDAREFERALRVSNRLAIRISFYDRTMTAIFEGVRGLWRTPVQPNLEYCGRY